ncbi:ZIP family metal transporter [Candidatus Microgenomates bacterium]|nr:ZIP family metal transporter [Candidatus Microgenomates bacterium]
MATWFHIIFFSAVGGVVSLIGGMLLLIKKSVAQKVARIAAPFAAGALLGAAFLDLLPEALELGLDSQVLYWTLLGILIFFLLERLLHWFHHHHEHALAQHQPTALLVILGDTVHNFIDGVAIAVGFIINVPTGIITAVAVAAHEIPQEVGDFGLLLNFGYRRKTVLAINFMSALATVGAAAITFALGASLGTIMGVLLGLTAGFFIYIAASDIIPTIHATKTDRIMHLESLLLLLGVLAIALTNQLTHRWLEPEAGTKTKISASQMISQTWNEPRPAPIPKKLVRG